MRVAYLGVPSGGNASDAGSAPRLPWNLAAHLSIAPSVLSALVDPRLQSYSAPPWLRARGDETLRWRVVALVDEGIPIAMSGWRDFSVKK